MKKKRYMTAYAELGSHGYPFEFAAGPVHDYCGPLLHIYATNFMPGLVKIRIELPPRKKVK